MISDVDLVRAAYDAFNRRGVDDVLAVISPDFVVEVPPELSVEPDAYRGHDGIRRYVESFDDVMEEVEFVIEGIEEKEGAVLVDTLLKTKARHTGLEAEQVVFIVWWVRGGKVIRGKPCATRAEAEAALS